METATPAYNQALIVDPNPATRAALQQLLNSHGYSCDQAGNLADAQAACEARAYPIVFAAPNPRTMPGPGLPAALRAWAPAAAIILIGTRRFDAVRAALHSDADDYLPRPVRSQALLTALERAQQTHHERAGRLAQEQAQAALLARLQTDQASLIQAAGLNALSRMAANLAHEINNPLTPILGMAALIREELPLDHIAHDYAETISISAQRIRDIVRSLLDFARPAAQQRAPIDLGALLRNTLLLAEQQLRDHSITTMMALPSQPLIVSASAAQIKQALLLLIDNAREAMPIGGQLRIELSAAQTDHEDALHHAGIHRLAIISLGDTGNGISPGHLPYIFEPFYSTKTQVAGVGLGLAVATSIIHAHGGRIEVESVENHGSTFRVLLPIDDET